MTNRPAGGLAARLLLSLAALAAVASAAWAHAFAPALLTITERGQGRFDVSWKPPLLHTDGAPKVLDAPQPVLPSYCRRLAEPRMLSPETSVDVAPSFQQVDCGSAGLRGAPISVSHLDGTGVDVIVRYTALDGTTEAGALRTSADAFYIQRSAGGPDVGSGFVAVIRGYVLLGIEHILVGVDHLLFVFGLVLLIWLDPGRHERRVRVLVKTITGFTVAHSLTLSLATLGWTTVSQAPVEALIALSIAMLAAELVRPDDGPPTWTRNAPWLVAMLFGLLHGFGFAGALAGIGLPPGQIPTALLGFNVGVEIGQLVFVSAVLVPVAGFARLAEHRPGLRFLPAYGLGTVAMIWMLQRIQQFWNS